MAVVIQVPCSPEIALILRQQKKHRAIAGVVRLLRWRGGTYATFRPTGIIRD
jgi:hypothetical protein